MVAFLLQKQCLIHFLRSRFYLHLFLLLLPLLFIGCHLISPPDLLGVESEQANFPSDSVQEVSEVDTWQEHLGTCQLGENKIGANKLAFIDWWEGKWVIDSKRLAQKLAPSMKSQYIDSYILSISQSLSAAFLLQLKAQQATLTINGQSQRLAISPFKKGQGIRLVGGGRELMMWCENSSVFWRSESGESFPLSPISNL